MRGVSARVHGLLCPIRVYPCKIQWALLACMHVAGCYALMHAIAVRQAVMLLRRTSICMSNETGVSKSQLAKYR